MNTYVKIRIDILEDAKIGQLPDRLWRRLIEISLLAKEYSGYSGDLPPVGYMAWRLRMAEGELLADLSALQGVDLVTLRRGGPIPKPQNGFAYSSDELLTIDWANVGWHVPGFKVSQVPSGYGPNWQSRRLSILARDHHTCQYCNAPAEHVDHIIPLSQGGSNDPENLVAACAKCNLTKNARTPEQAGMRILSKKDIDNGPWQTHQHLHLDK